MKYSIGLDYGTNSVRCLLVDIETGQELATSVYGFETGQAGIILDPNDHNLARQHPADYLKGLENTVQAVLNQAQANIPDFNPDDIIGIGVDTTGSTPLPVDKNGTPLALLGEFKDNPNAMAWLWKDHTSFAEAQEITQLAAKQHPEYLAVCGGTYSSEWSFSKILHCLRVDPKVFDAAFTWIEHCDWMTALLTGTDRPDQLKRCRCAAGHKAMFNSTWGGNPAQDFLTNLDPKLESFYKTLSKDTFPIDIKAGDLIQAWADKLGLPAGIPVAMSAFDAHMGAVGSGIAPGKMVQIIGTSSCHMVVFPNDIELPDIQGICGIVDGSILPGHFGIESGQSATGDIFNWFVNYIQPGGPQAGTHESLTEKAALLKPGQSGLLALDWNNGNRSILADQRLTGLLIGQTLHTRPEEIYRALIEATVFGTLTIIKRLEEYNISVNEIINCGGITEKNALLMQIYADVTGREMKISRSSQTCALGAAIAGAVAAGKNAGGYDTVDDAQQAMCAVQDTSYKPIAENQKIYQQLYGLYKQLHDSFGLADHQSSLGNVMKQLLKIKTDV